MAPTPDYSTLDQKWQDVGKAVERAYELDLFLAELQQQVSGSPALRASLPPAFLARLTELSPPPTVLREGSAD